MARRKIKPILLASHAVDSTFPSKLKNRHVTRLGNPATREGATYVALDKEGLLLTAIDLEYLRLIVEGIPITESMKKLVQDRVRREQMLLDHNIGAQGVPEQVRMLFELSRKADVRKYCSNLQISEFEFFLLIHNCNQLAWSHRSKFPQYVPSHLQITDEDEHKLHRGDIIPLATKVGPLMQERRRIHIHFFEQDKLWHCFYFSYDDLLSGNAAHWKHGPHLHYVSHLWPRYHKDQVWSLFDTRYTDISGAFHIRFAQFEYPPPRAQRDYVPVSLFGYQPMLSVINANLPSALNFNPIPTAQVATRGFWTGGISTLT
jgi:hypothetical protein